MSWVAVAVAGATLVGTVATNQANKKAAKTANEAEQQAAQVANEEIKRGIAEGDVLYGQIREQTQPGVNYVRDIIGAPTSLTPAQRMALDDVRRQVVNNSQVAGSALRGSGRSFVDAMRSVENDFQLKALDQNRQRADQAALEFIRPNFNAAGSQAAAHATQGQQVGNNLANATLNSGYNSANATTANAGNWGSALKDIGSAIGASQKEQTRPSKYEEYKPTSGVDY